MKRLQIPRNLVYEKFYVHEIAAVDLSKMYFLKIQRKHVKQATAIQTLIEWWKIGADYSGCLNSFSVVKTMKLE